MITRLQLLASHRHDAAGIVVVSLVAVGIRLAVMNGVQQRHARQNRQINERLNTLIAALQDPGWLVL